MARLAVTTEITQPNWQVGLPSLAGDAVTLRELRASDAESLAALLTTGEVTRFISPPPTTAAGFRRFIAWTHAQRELGTFACFGIVPRGMDVAVGVLQFRFDPGFQVAEMGAVLAREFWGTGTFKAGADLLLEWAFDEVGVHRVEARVALQNGRASGAVRKLGAMREGVLRRSLELNGQLHDQWLWSVLESDWRPSKAVWGAAFPVEREMHGGMASATVYAH